MFGVLGLQGFGIKEPFRMFGVSACAVRFYQFLGLRVQAWILRHWSSRASLRLEPDRNHMHDPEIPNVKGRYANGNYLGFYTLIPVRVL